MGARGAVVLATECLASYPLPVRPDPPPPPTSEKAFARVLTPPAALAPASAPPARGWAGERRGDHSRQHPTTFSRAGDDTVAVPWHGAGSSQAGHSPKALLLPPTVCWMAWIWAAAEGGGLGTWRVGWVLKAACWRTKSVQVEPVDAQQARNGLPPHLPAALPCPSRAHRTEGAERSGLQHGWAVVLGDVEKACAGTAVSGPRRLTSWGAACRSSSAGRRAAAAALEQASGGHRCGAGLCEAQLRRRQARGLRSGAGRRLSKGGAGRSPGPTSSATANTAAAVGVFMAPQVKVMKGELQASAVGPPPPAWRQRPTDLECEVLSTHEPDVSQRSNKYMNGTEGKMQIEKN